MSERWWLDSNITGREPWCIQFAHEHMTDCGFVKPFEIRQDSLQVSIQHDCDSLYTKSPIAGLYYMHLNVELWPTDTECRVCLSDIQSLHLYLSAAAFPASSVPVSSASSASVQNNGRYSRLGKDCR